MFKPNESDLDKKVRLLIGIVALLLGIFFFTGFWQILAVIVGIIGIVTGLTGFCLIYKILGIKTNK